MDLLQALGLSSPVFWYIPNNPGKSHEVDKVDIEYARLANFGVYYCVNQLGSEFNNKRHKRFRENVTKFLAFFTDFDTGSKQEQLADILLFELKPSAIVESGRGYHAYWFIEGEITPQRWTHIQTKLAEYFGSDGAVNDPARLMRLPGSWHTKGEPMLVSIQSLEPKRKYTEQDFLKIFPYTEPKIWRLGAKHNGKVTLPALTLTEGTRHAALKRWGGFLFRGCNHEQVPERTAELKAWYVQSCKPLKENWETEVEDLIAFILPKELC